MAAVVIVRACLTHGVECDERGDSVWCGALGGHRLHEGQWVPARQSAVPTAKAYNRAARKRAVEAARKARVAARRRIMDREKCCNVCGQVKLWAEFHRGSGGWPQARCKACQKEASRDWKRTKAATDPEWLARNAVTRREDWKVPAIRAKRLAGMRAWFKRVGLERQRERRRARREARGEQAVA